MLLASCYQERLKLASANGVYTIAFPAISTGIYRFPKDRAAKIAVDQTLIFCADHNLPERSMFCGFSDTDAGIYRQALGHLA